MYTGKIVNTNWVIGFDVRAINFGQLLMHIMYKIGNLFIRGTQMASVFLFFRSCGVSALSTGSIAVEVSVLSTDGSIFFKARDFLYCCASCIFDCPFLYCTTDPL